MPNISKTNQIDLPEIVVSPSQGTLHGQGNKISSNDLVHLQNLETIVESPVLPEQRAGRRLLHSENSLALLTKFGQIKRKSNSMQP